MLDEKVFEKTVQSANILVNTNSVGMHPNEDNTLVPKELLHENLSVMDIIYNPLETKLIQDAKTKGLKTVGGLDMFVNQAASQFEAWTNQAAPKQLMRQVVMNILK